MVWGAGVRADVIKADLNDGYLKKYCPILNPN